MSVPNVFLSADKLILIKFLKVDKKEENTTSIDFEAEEKLKRRKNAFLSFINRSGPANPGSKEVPIGAEGCFEGLCFVITGVMDSLTSEEIREIVSKYGGRCVTSLSSKFIVG